MINSYGELRNMYAKWNETLSLADYAVISAYRAVKAGVAKDTGGCNFRACSIDFTFKSGRKTCDNPNSPPTTTSFPHGADVNAHNTHVKQPFKLTDKETVALMGKKVTFTLLLNT